MLATLIAVINLHLVLASWKVWIIIIEVTLILEFAAYWVIQTIDLWNTPDRRERLSVDAQNRVDEARRRGVAGLRSELAEARKGPRGERFLPLL